uniref:Kinesin motor domain-containing protein n=1 Tax=Fagus sylvatica TaxID=28930 RepID=A0A2N9FHC8_FAGSY
MSGTNSTRSQRSTSSISPFRSRKSPAPPPPYTKSAGRPVTPSSTTRPPSKLSVSPANSASPSPSPNPNPSPPTLTLDRPDGSKSKENVTVTVRFRPLSAREINKGDEIAWYADGDYTVRNEYNPSVTYGFDRVFGPATTTRHVYDVAAQQVVSGAMQGINGTVFAYGVTSSGKTHTMHGEQKSPGIIPLAVKDVFGIIQETPGHEFLLRVSYLEIYNEAMLFDVLLTMEYSFEQSTRPMSECWSSVSRSVAERGCGRRRPGRSSMFGLLDSLSLANGRGLMTGFFWTGTSVYSPTLEGIRNGFWEELALIQHRWGSPWCLFGDFNTVCFPRERLGSNQFNPAMIAFSDFINSANLIDLPLEGGLFTWCNGSDPPSMSRIDYVLVSADWEEHFPNVTHKLLPKPISDHSPILVEAGVLLEGNLAWWLDANGLPFEMIEEEAQKARERRVIEEDVLGFFEEVFEHGKFEKLLNVTFIALIPKKDPEQLLYIRSVLTCFAAVTGFKVNLSKSEMVPIGEVSNMRLLFDILCYRTRTLPMSYLGMLLDSSFKSLSVWNPIIEKMKCRLVGWKRLHLSKEGGLTLLKSTLSSLLTYFLSLFTIPASVAKRIERLQRNFLWDSTDEAPRSHGCGVWKSIMMGWDSFAKHVSFKVGIGSQIRLWHDRWCEDCPLKEVYLFLFDVASNREAIVADVLTRQDAGGPFGVLQGYFSLGEASGVAKHPRVCASLYDAMESRWTVSFCIALWQEFCGILFFNLLALSGLSPRR